MMHPHNDKWSAFRGIVPKYILGAVLCLQRVLRTRNLQQARLGGQIRDGLAPPILTAAVTFVSILLPISQAAAVPTDAKVSSAECISVPTTFSTPAVKDSEAPVSLWEGWTYSQAVTLDAIPIFAPTDQQITIRVTGLAPGEPVTLHASSSDYRKRIWAAQATFLADDKGVVDPARQAPEYGSYSGTHAMGLIWSLQPLGIKDSSSTHFFPADDTYTVELQVEANGHTLARTTLTRLHQAPNVSKAVITSDGLVGEFYRPTMPGLHPAVLVLGGSDGGLYPQVDEAALLAAHGYAAFGLAYFQGYEDPNNPVLVHLPEMLVNIPLEYFVKAADWLKRQPGVDARHVAIMGWSRGAEAALITAATFPKEFQAVIGVMPSSVVWTGINNGQGPTTSAWTLGGKPLPWVNPVVTPGQFKPGEMMAFRGTMQTGLQNQAEVAKAVIPVEDIDAPVLLISAGDDQVWPSSLMADQIMKRLAEHRHAYADKSLCYAAAGHEVLPPYHPTNASAFGYPGGGGSMLGGKPTANAFAEEDSWLELLKFLDTNFMSASRK